MQRDSSRRQQDNKIFKEKKRDFGCWSSSPVFNLIEQKALLRDSHGLVIERRDKAKSF
jgi:hypothetical protein